MANITKRAAKRLSEHLRDGESISVAVLTEPKGTYGLGVVKLALAPRSAQRALGVEAAERRRQEGGLAAGFPAEPAVIAVTETRVLVAPSNGLTFRPPVMDVPLGSLLVGDLSAMGMGRRMELVFTDGTTVVVDMQRGQPIADLVSMLGRAN